MHVLPVLGAIAEEHRNEPVVILGVHSAKFTAEREPERVHEAMRRYGVRHPVVVDQDMTIWRSYAIRTWPTLVFIRPDGTIAGIAPGEPTIEELEEIVRGLLVEARFEKTLAGAKSRIEWRDDARPDALSFPGKVIATPGGGLAVSDSGHHRILFLEEDGRVQNVIGSGNPGLADGPAHQARFTRPQGLAIDGETLYVADTGNHALRAVNLQTLTVTTLAGDGTLGRMRPRGFRHAPDVALRSPWDLALSGKYLMIAMAGIHQIWLYFAEEKAIAVLAGAGAERIDDGPFLEATFSQPTGLAMSGSLVFVADSETSAVREMDMDARIVRTIVGKGLFDFGDVDGPREQARLQHVQGVSFGPHGLLVTDTYNDKIKRVDVKTGRVETWYVGEGDLTLAEPAGLCQLANGEVVVADTNHHRLLVISKDARWARVLSLKETAAQAASRALPALRVTAEPDTVGAGELELHLVLTPPRDLHIAEGAPLDVHVSVSRGQGALAMIGSAEPIDVSGSDSALLRVTLRATLGADPVRAEASVRVVTTLCGSGKNAACWPVEGEYRIFLTLTPGAPTETIVARLPLPRPEIPRAGGIATRRS